MAPQPKRLTHSAAAKIPAKPLSPSVPASESDTTTVANTASAHNDSDLAQPEVDALVDENDDVPTRLQHNMNERISNDSDYFTINNVIRPARVEGQSKEDRRILEFRVALGDARRRVRESNVQYSRFRVAGNLLDQFNRTQQYLTETERNDLQQFLNEVLAELAEPAVNLTMDDQDHVRHAFWGPMTRLVLDRDRQPANEPVEAIASKKDEKKKARNGQHTVATSTAREQSTGRGNSGVLPDKSESAEEPIPLTRVKFKRKQSTGSQNGGEAKKPKDTTSALKEGKGNAEEKTEKPGKAKGKGNEPENGREEGTARVKGKEDGEFDPEAGEEDEFLCPCGCKKLFSEISAQTKVDHRKAVGRKLRCMARGCVMKMTVKPAEHGTRRDHKRHCVQKHGKKLRRAKWTPYKKGFPKKGLKGEDDIWEDASEDEIDRRYLGHGLWEAEGYEAGAAVTSTPDAAQPTASEIFASTFPVDPDPLDTPSHGHMCGLYAVILTMEAMYPDLPHPTVRELEEVFFDENFRAEMESFGEMNIDTLDGQQIAAVLFHWGAHYHRLNLRVGFWGQGIPQFFVSHPNDDPAIIVWIHNDNAEEILQGDDGEVVEISGHWSGLRPVALPARHEQNDTAGEDEYMEIRGDGDERGSLDAVADKDEEEEEGSDEDSSSSSRGDDMAGDDE